MKNLTGWDYYWNEELDDRYRANLVYTSLVSADRKTFCMRFHRDPAYHSNLEENKLWTEEILQDRFDRELEMHRKASAIMSTVEILEVDYTTREIYIRWPGDDFYMQGYRSNYDTVLPDWQEQIKEAFRKMWGAGLCKFSMHPNSWLVFDDGILRPFNWFFTIDVSEGPKSVNDYIIQLSDQRQEKLGDLDLDQKYSIWDLQEICLHSFRHNYPSNLIDELIQIKREYQ